jgi:uncharacterized protein (DUF58 family)
MATEAAIAGRPPGPWQRLVNSLRDRFLERLRRQRGMLALPYALEYRFIYILPTWFGSGFALMLVLTALGGLNFNNNLALLLVFVLGALAQSTTLLAYRNLAGLRIEAVRAEAVFAGDPLAIQVFVANPEQRERYSLQLALAAGHSDDCIDIKAMAGGCLRARVPTVERGWLSLPGLRLETRYPLAMFKAWSWIFPGGRVLVYPRPATRHPPLPASGAGRSGKAHKGEGDQVHGLRNYRSGDSLRRVAWRTSARHDSLFTREMETPQEQSCVLAWDSLAGMDTEQRLSVLAAWVLLADHRQLSYSLVMPGQSISAGKGPDHRARCLEVLAVYGL